MNPCIHNDIAYCVSDNWKELVDKMIPNDSEVSSYTFPIPIDSEGQGRISYLRSGRMIYEFINMMDEGLVSVAYKYNYIAKTDIKSFYRSLYTHSIPWAIHGKEIIRMPENFNNYELYGNRLDKLFQNANDGCTNGIPVGPVVSDIAAEIVASAIDIAFTNKANELEIDYEAVRFKDDYRILSKSEYEAKQLVKVLQSALNEYHLELNDEKTTVSPLPDGLFRQKASRYHVIRPKDESRYSWEEFYELYLSVIQSDKEHPDTGVIDRFLADIVNENGLLKVEVQESNIQKIISMFIMLGKLRIKSFPKILAIFETIIKHHSIVTIQFESIPQQQIIDYLNEYLKDLLNESERNQYLIIWIIYFLKSNNLLDNNQAKCLIDGSVPPEDLIIKSVLSGRGTIFNDCRDFKLFVGCRTAAKKVKMLEYLDIFNRLKDDQSP